MPAKTARIKMLVDSGAAYSVAPAPFLEKLGIKPRTKRSFVLANGTEVERKMSGALVQFQGEEGYSPVIFGEKDDAALLGMVTLESLGLILDPLRRILLPMQFRRIRWMIRAVGLPRFVLHDTAKHR
jgi:predicted aspartyl protease